MTARLLLFKIKRGAVGGLRKPIKYSDRLAAFHGLFPLPDANTGVLHFQQDWINDLQQVGMNYQFADVDIR